MTAGAAGVIVHLYERTLGHHSRIPISDTEITLPVVHVSSDLDLFRQVFETNRVINKIIFNDFLTLSGLLQNSTVIVQITPGKKWLTNVYGDTILTMLKIDESEFHALVFNTGWFIALNIFFGLVYLFLLGLVIRKFVLKVRASGFILNISFVYLAFQAVFCIRKSLIGSEGRYHRFLILARDISVMIVRWLDPLNAHGFYILEVDIFIEAAPVSWACILYTICDLIQFT